MIKINGTILEVPKYPNGEVKLEYGLLDLDKYLLEWYYEGNDAEFMQLYLLTRHLKAKTTGMLILDIKYMPYSRLDRTKKESEVFTLKYIADFINSLKFDKVLVGEAHSDVTPALLNNCEVYSIVEGLIKEVMQDMEFDLVKDYLLFPDGGASKRYKDLVKELGCKNVLEGYKSRDWVTGEIQSLKINGALIPNETPKVLIIDDLCAFGGTFKYAAKVLKETLPKCKVYLLVGHSEPNILKGNLLNDDSDIELVYTSNSLVRKLPTEKVKIYNI